VSSLADWFGSVTGIAGKTAENLGESGGQYSGKRMLAVHTREEEREADYLGVRCAKKAGYDPRGMIGMFRKLQQLSKDDAGILGHSSAIIRTFRSELITRSMRLIALKRDGGTSQVIVGT